MINQSKIDDEKNQYFFLCGETAVKIRFAGDITIEERLKNYFLRLKSFD